jgi:hypothetical protein
MMSKDLKAIKLAEIEFEEKRLPTKMKKRVCKCVTYFRDVVTKVKPLSLNPQVQS